MPAYLHPGVYIEEIPSGSKPIEAVGTSTAVFIGYTEKGTLDEPSLITSWDDYELEYGGLRETEIAVSGSSYVAGDPMGFAVYHYFKNGGGKAYIVRIASEGTGLSASSQNIRNGADDADLIHFEAVNEGEWGDSLVIVLTAKDSDNFKVEVGSGTGDDFVPAEVFGQVTLDESASDFILSVINDASELVQITEVGDQTELTTNLSADDGVTELVLTGGQNGSNPTSDEYEDVFSALLKYRDINVVMLPGLSWDGGSEQAIIESGIAHCEAMQNRMIIIDLPAGSELEDENGVIALGLSTSTYAATYYPWPLVANPFYDPDTNPGAATMLLVPPSAYAAGQWAKTDGRRGVWKAPAGVESNLLGVSKFEFKVENAEQDYLNPQGINALRSLPNYGSVIWGARTRSTKANPEWRYVPVRRTAMFIEESIFNGIQWAVFEPNDHRLWSALRTNIDSFMNGLFRVGAFQGEKASDAYFVRCGLGQTMKQGDIDRGQVIVQIGFAPLKPAEFVIVRIQQKVGQQ